MFIWHWKLWRIASCCETTELRTEICISRRAWALAAVWMEKTVTAGRWEKNQMERTFRRRERCQMERTFRRKVRCQMARTFRRRVRCRMARTFRGRERCQMARIFHRRERCQIEITFRKWEKLPMEKLQISKWESWVEMAAQI